MSELIIHNYILTYLLLISFSLYISGSPTSAAGWTYSPSTVRALKLKLSVDNGGDGFESRNYKKVVKINSNISHTRQFNRKLSRTSVNGTQFDIKETSLIL